MDYYCYCAFDKNIPRYVGFGKGRRWEHVNSGTSHIRKLNEATLRDGTLFRIEFVHINLSRDCAIKLEQELIEYYGREDLNTGSLWNTTAGGIGFRSYHNEDTKRNISQHSIQMWEQLTEKERTTRINRFLSVGKGTRFKKGRINHNRKQYQIIDSQNNVLIAGLWKDCAKKLQELGYVSRNNNFDHLKRSRKPIKQGQFKGWQTNLLN